MVAVMVLGPAVVAVEGAGKKPSLLCHSVVKVPWALRVPSANVTVAPPVVSGMSLESFAVNVTVVVPLIATLVGEMATVVCAGSAGPAPLVTVIVGAVEVTC